MVELEKFGSKYERRDRVVSWGTGAQGSLLRFLWEIGKPVCMGKYEREEIG